MKLRSLRLLITLNM